jgi:hypothetical protein
MKKKIFLTFLVMFALIANVTSVFAATPDGTGPFADFVEDNNQGFRKDGSSVLDERSDPTNALGAPENVINPPSFYSLGFGGDITLGFDNYICTDEILDVKAYEITGGSYPKEVAEVLVSQDNVDYFSVGEVNNMGSSSVNLPDSLYWVQYVKLVDKSDKTLFPNNADGYDLDAVEALHSSEDKAGCRPLNKPPVADPNGPYLGAINTDISFDGTGSSDPDGDALTYNWDFGDGTEPGTGSEPMHSYSGSGIYTVCLTVNDGYVDSEPACTSAVVYDPSGGFVTGGGWIDSPPGAYKGHEFDIPTLVWDQDFSLDDTGWLDDDDGWYGDISVAGGTATFYGDSDSAPFSRFDGYRDVWPGTWTAELDVYLDPSWPSGQGFDYSVAASGSDGNHQRDYIFHITKDTSTGKLLVAGSNNTNFAPREDLENINHFEVTTAGWYTLQHKFYESSGALAVDLNLVDSSGTVLFTETRFNATDTIPDEIGGNRYAWFTYINIADGIQVDNHQLIVPTSPPGKATFGFVSKYKKGADVPTGNTEFQFKDGDLNFHSTSYDWLVVTGNGSDYAKFKGTGTINGEGTYKFQIWAGDDDPDTFRIKIWYEDGGSEVVVYDNGMDQEIGGGSIVVHTKK